jgi:hypothetical protein
MRAGFCTKPLNTEFVCIVRDFQTIVNANLLKQKQPHARADVQSLRNHALRAELSFLVVNLHITGSLLFKTLQLLCSQV